MGGRRSAAVQAFVRLIRHVLVALMLLAPVARAHEIPQRVAIRGFVQHDDTTLRLLLRVPLEAMRDVDFPLRDDGSLDLVGARALLPDAAQVWLVNAIRLTANGRQVGAARITGTRLALPGDMTFDQFATARAAFTQPPVDSVRIQWQQVLFDVALEYTVPAADAHLVLHPDLATLGIRTTSVLHVIGADGTDRTLTYDGNPASVELNPAWYHTAAQFMRIGFQHILGGADHILFVLCLVIPDRLWFPPLVEALIAASIVWVAIENIVLPAERLEARWGVAFAFGLVHGFGFSFALAHTLQFAGGNLVSALLAFNAGVELGQLGVLAAAVPVLWALRRYAGSGAERVLTIVLSVLVAHTAWHWLGGRVEALAAHRGSLGWPAADAATALLAVRFALLGAVALAVALSMRQILRVARRS